MAALRRLTAAGDVLAARVEARGLRLASEHMGASALVRLCGALEEAPSGADQANALSAIEQEVEIVARVLTPR